MDAITKTDYQCLHENPLDETEAGMSNFDHTHDEGCEEQLEGGKTMANYAGYNFHAYVYKPSDLYVADIHCYGSHRGFITGKTLDELMDNVSNRYGWD